MKACLGCGEWAPARARFCAACGASLSAAPAVRERRKVVSVVFADVVGSTALGERVDSETLRWAMQRWAIGMRDVVERHGGIVEKYIGDAVMAVFGIPVAHEDDALRAVRAAADMREEVASLRAELSRERGVELAVRIGVNTGEAVTGAAADGGVFTTGDTVNVAARLEQSAPTGEVLLGRATLRLVAHAVDAEPVAPLTLKGKSAPVEAFRLLAVEHRAPGRPQRKRAPLVGRASERFRLLEAVDRTLTERTPRLVTVLGPAGVGKSRLVGEVVDTLTDVATVAPGRCLPYGDGLTWWPLAEALVASGLLAQVASDDEPALALAAEVLKPAGERVAREDAFWAIRTLLRTIARRRPLILVIDDLQWADSPLLELVEHVIDRGGEDTPLLVLAMARPELLETRPGWVAAKPNVTSLMLDPLAEAQAGDLLRHLLGSAPLGDRAAARILDVAQGNPLFLEEVVAMLADDGLEGTEEIAVPPTIQALLAARLDRLDATERAVIEAASIEGKEFTRGHVEALLSGPGSEALDDHLAALVAKELIEPASTGVFRFGHQLIRDAAYDGMAKQLRADLHERFANAREADAARVAEELLGYHLERAVVLRRELGEPETATADVAARATANLSVAGRRAAQRADPHAASAMIERAIALAGSDDATRGALVPELGTALFEAGRMADATRVLDDAIATAPSPRFAALARIEREFVRLETDPSGGTEPARRLAGEVLPVLEAAGDHRGQCRALSLEAVAAWIGGQVGKADAAFRAAADHARLAADERELFTILGWRATAAVLGPTPVPEAIRRCEEFRDLVASSPVTVAWMVNPLASLHAMRGDLEQARSCVQEANEILDRLGTLHASVSHHESLVWLIGGRPELAEKPLRAGIERLEPMGGGEVMATTKAMLAQAVYAQGRLAEAADLCRAAAATASPDDVVTQVIWRGVQAKILAAAGDCDEAQELARAGVAIAASTDLLSHHGDAMLDLAEVLILCARERQAVNAIEAALKLYEQKGNLAAAARARSLAANRSGRV